MAEETIRKTANLFDSWWKILSVIGALVFGIYQLSLVWVTISDTKLEVKDLKEAIVKDNLFRDDRSDKRYDRAIKMYEELKEHGMKLEIELEKHLIEDAYQRGKIDGQIQILLNKK